MEKKYELSFMITLFGEVNSHIRATDNKHITIAGSYISLIAVVAAILIDKYQVSWLSFFFSLFILLLGSSVWLMQLWYRKWKEHYLEICKNISDQFEKNDSCCPYWLKEKRNRTFSADKFLLGIPIIINFAVAFYTVSLFCDLLGLGSIKFLLSLLSIPLYYICIWSIAKVTMNLGDPMVA